jgi:hypothetical protein
VVISEFILSQAPANLETQKYFLKSTIRPSQELDTLTRCRAFVVSGMAKISCAANPTPNWPKVSCAANSNQEMFDFGAQQAQQTLKLGFAARNFFVVSELRCLRSAQQSVFKFFFILSLTYTSRGIATKCNERTDFARSNYSNRVCCACCASS